MIVSTATDRPGAVGYFADGGRAVWLSSLFCLFALGCLAPALANDNDRSPEPAASAKKESASEEIRRIGAVATITEVSTGLPFPARVDTGATTCAIHYEELEIEDASERPEENVGKRVRIRVKNPDGEEDWISTKIVDHVVVRTTTDDDERYKVRLKLRWQDVEKQVLVTLSDREKMKYPVLLGRNFLRGDFLVDVNLDGEH